jgi:transcriptional regulator with XRE-family HTH domain
MPNNTEIQKIFGARVREEREKRKITQAELAKKIGIHQPDLGDIEKGRHAVTLATVERVADVFSLPPAELLG